MNQTKGTTARRAAGSARRTVGERLIAGLTEVAEVLERGEPLGARFTVRTVELPDPPGAYDPAAVRQTRARIGASQAVFARLLAVSLHLVQAWEQGVRTPSPLARRLLDEVNAAPDRWAARARDGADRRRPGRAARPSRTRQPGRVTAGMG